MRGVVLLCAALAGLLIVSGGLMLLGRNERKANPSATSYQPSGTMAFRELLEQSGYKTEVTLSTRPKIAAGDLLVVFDYLVSADETFFRALSKQAPKAQEAVTEHLKAGGRVLLLPVDREFAESSKLASTTSSAIHSPDSGTPIPLSLGTGQDPETNAMQYLEDAPRAPVSLWLTASDEPFAEAMRYGTGRLIVVRDGIFATNRFLDRKDNARVAVGLVLGLARPGSRVVFDEAGFGNAVEPGLLESIGPWAEAVWFQFLFLFVVVVFSLGKRFGLPTIDRRPQPGARELLQAVSYTLRRGRMTSAALDLTVRDAERVLRRALQIPSDAPPAALVERLPDGLRRALTDVRSAATMKTSPAVSRDLLEKLDREMAAMLGPARSGSSRPQPYR